MDKQSARVLIVDDEQDNLDYLQRSLRRDFELHTALSGAEGIALLKQHDFSIVISDQRMPEMTGVEFLFRSIEYAPNACRIMLTGYSDVEATIEAINRSQVSNFMRKPVCSDRLRHEVNRSMESYNLRDRAQCLISELERDNSGIDDDFRKRCQELARINRQLGELAVRDSLTGLYNNCYFKERLKEEISRARRYVSKLAVVFCDIDHFKAYNDKNGHRSGDECLIEVAQIMGPPSRYGSSGQSRDCDIVTRYGGEEFAMILPETDKVGAAAKAERIRLSIESHDFPGVEGLAAERLTISAGVAGFPEDGADPTELLDRADRALYQAKKEGRNRVCIYGE